MRVEVKEGQTLWDALRESGYAIDRPCGGRGSCGRCRVEVAGRGVVLSCTFRKPGHFEVFPDTGQSFEGGLLAAQTILHEDFRYPSAAVDVGTTTVTVFAIYQNHISERSFVNPQRQYGADVLSRIDACNGGKEQLLRQLLIERLSEELVKAFREVERQSGERLADWRIAVGANTTMLHILLGYSCEGLGRAPFRPVRLGAEQRCTQLEKYRIDVFIFPGISAYIGADIVSGIYGTGMAEREDICVFADLGTNAEMAVGNANRLLCASAAAGPAFEGSELAIRLHASGILRLLHGLLERGQMDGYGLLAEPFFETGVEAGAGVRMMQDEVRDIQMAKGAVRAGIEILLEEYGVEAAEVSRVYLAGGMGYYLNPEDALAIGLFPRDFAGKLQAVGNTCLTGGLRYLSDEQGENLPEMKMTAEDGTARTVKQLERLVSSAEEILLANHRRYEELYIENMNFNLD